MNKKDDPNPVNINIQTDSKDVDMSDSDVMTSEEALAKITTTMADPKKIELMTQVTDREIRLISALQTIADEAEITVLNDFIKHLLELKVSQDRQGRKEIIEMTRNQRTGDEAGRMRKMLNSVGLFK